MARDNVKRNITNIFQICWTGPQVAVKGLIVYVAKY